MTKKNKWITATELVARLNADPEYVARRARAEHEHNERTAELSRAEAPLLEELRCAGHSLGSVWDLVNTRTHYPEAIPILLTHIQRSYPDAVREGIARALAVPEARSGWDLLARLYEETTPGRLKSGLAVALAGAAGDAQIGSLIALARDKRNGSSRVLLLSALARSADARARDALVDLVDDPEVRTEARLILRRLRR